MRMARCGCAPRAATWPWVRSRRTPEPPRAAPPRRWQRSLASGARRPDPRFGSTCQREHQLVEALHKRRRVVELTALGQGCLIEQDVTPIREPAAVRFVL